MELAPKGCPRAMIAQQQALFESQDDVDHPEGDTE